MSDASSTPAPVANDAKNSAEKHQPPTLQLEKHRMVASSPATSPDTNAAAQQFLSVQIGPGVVPAGGHVTQAVYTVAYRTNLPQFANTEGSVDRRFVDFVNLWGRLRDGYAKFCVVLPARPPDRPLTEAARARIFSSNDGASNASAQSTAVQHTVSFADRRRARLARFLERCVEHPDLKNSRELLDFLEGREAPTPPATGVGAVRALAASIGDSMAALGGAAAAAADEETDEWFADRYDELDDAAGRFGRLRACLDSVAGQRRAYAGQNSRLAENLNRLAAAQPDAGLGLALNRMSETLAGLCQFQHSQAEAEELELCDLLDDLCSGLSGQRDCLTERARSRRALAEAEMALNKRREARVRAQISGRSASGPQPAELEALEDEVERRQLAFEAVSQAAKRELLRSDRRCYQELRAAVATCLRRQAEAARRALIGWEAAASETAAFLAVDNEATPVTARDSAADC